MRIRKQEDPLRIDGMLMVVPLFCIGVTELIQRTTLADRLEKVIQVLQLGRKTGILSVERGDERSLEEGWILFDQGKIIQSQLGPWRDQDALRILRSWEHCRFAFVPLSKAMLSSPFQLPAPISTQETDPFLSTHTTSAVKSVRPPNTSKELTNEMMLPTTPLPITAAPYRTLSTDEALQRIGQAGLSRAHRHLFLLIDGNRKLADLIRLVGRPSNDIFKMINDLEALGVILL